MDQDTSDPVNPSNVESSQPVETQTPNVGNENASSIQSDEILENGKEIPDPSNEAVEEANEPAHPKPEEDINEHDNDTNTESAQLQHDLTPSEKEVIHELSDDDIQIGSNTDSESSSDSDSSSDSSSDSESDISDGDAEELSDNEEDKITGPIVSKNEVVNEKAPTLPEGYELGDKPIEPLGDITGFVENSVIIKGDVSAEFRVLKENSILCLKDKVIGPLFEIFGNLKAPVYRVKFNEPEKVEEFKELKGQKAYYVVPDSEFTLTDALKKLKGSDASNFNDEEIPEEEQEFSDDEKEMAAKKKRKNKNSDKKKDKKKPRANQNQAETFTSYNPPQQFHSYNQPQQSHESLPQPPQLYQQYPPNNQHYGNQPSVYGQPFVSQTQTNHYGQPIVPMQPYGQSFYPQQPYPPVVPVPFNQQHQPYQNQQNFQPTSIPSSIPPKPMVSRSNNPQPSQGNDQSEQLTNALANASPEQLKLLEQLLKNQMNK